MSTLDSRVARLEARYPNWPEPARCVIWTETYPEPVAAPGERLLVIRLVAPRTERAATGTLDGRRAA